MRARIFRSILTVAVSVLVVCCAIIMGVLYEYFSKAQNNQLKSELSIAAHGVERDGTEWLDSLEADGYRLTLVSADGTVLYDNEADAAAMENHAQREEIRQAVATGRGESVRISATLTKKTLYQAVKLSDGNILRMSITQSSVLALLLGMLPPVCFILLAAIAISAILANHVTKRTVAPINALDLEHPLENDAYPELSQLLLRVAHQQRQINAQLGALREKQDEFATITKSMNEGLVLLNGRGAIVSINPAAYALFGADQTAVGKDFLAMERNRAVQCAVNDAEARGHGQANIARNGRQYEIDVSRIVSDGQTTGTVILSFDITEKATAEEQRRAFSANVSHELKTPLQSIMGSAELMENGLVRPEDMPRFTGHIRSEAQRLVALIDDIIRLSQLDEGMELHREPVDLASVAQDAVTQLANAAEAKQVQLLTSCASATVSGVKPLLHQIVYNLVDNAIRYNRVGGSVLVSVAETDTSAVLTVEDNGIGIPEAHQSRIFERFYRVDKSHSKETGGTGLGLSIVKHAVLLHGGEIRLESAEGKGTGITVTLPKA